MLNPLQRGVGTAAKAHFWHENLHFATFRFRITAVFVRGTRLTLQKSSHTHCALSAWDLRKIVCNMSNLVPSLLHKSSAQPSILILRKSKKNRNFFSANHKSMRGGSYFRPHSPAVNRVKTHGEISSYLYRT